MAVQAQSRPAMQVPLLDLKPQYRAAGRRNPGGDRKGLRESALHLGPA